MSKGQQLGIMLDEADKIHEQQRQLFIKNNVPHLEINQLPEPDKKEWHRLHSLSNELGDKMCKLILNK